MKISRFSPAVLFPALFILMALKADAQIEFGIKGGLNVSEISTARYESVNIGGNPQYIRNFPRKGIHAGVMLSIPLTKRLSLQPEALFSEQGSTGKPSSMYQVSATESYQINWLNVPVLIKYSWPSGLFAETGPQLSYLLNAEIGETVVGASATSYYNVNNQYKSTDLGWTLGVGYISPVNLGFDLRYTMGLSNFSNISAGESAPVQNGSLKNSVVQVGVFFLFGKPRTQFAP